MSIGMVLKPIIAIFTLAILAGVLFIANNDTCKIIGDCKNREQIKTKVKFTNKKKEIMLNVEVASTKSDRERGLMYRPEMDEDWGMLFIFDNEDFHSFWMKNTLIYLDMIFVNKDKKIVDIIEKAEPCKSKSCPFYTPKKRALYVIEVNGGWTRKNDIKINDKVDIIKST